MTLFAINVRIIKITQRGSNMNKECNKCEGQGWYEVPNYRLEIMERIECMDCLVEEQYKDHLKDELTRLMTSVSQQKLAQIVAELIVNGVDRNPKDDLNRIDVIIQTKNTMNALQLGSAYSNQ